MSIPKRPKADRWIPYACLVAMLCVFVAILVGTRGGYERKDDSAGEGVPQSASVAQRGDEAEEETS